MFDCKSKLVTIYRIASAQTRRLSFCLANKNPLLANMPTIVNCQISYTVVNMTLIWKYTKRAPFYLHPQCWVFRPDSCPDRHLSADHSQLPCCHHRSLHPAPTSTKSFNATKTGKQASASVLLLTRGQSTQLTKQVNSKQDYNRCCTNTDLYLRWGIGFAQVESYLFVDHFCHFLRQIFVARQLFQKLWKQRHMFLPFSVQQGCWHFRLCCEHRTHNAIEQYFCVTWVLIGAREQNLFSFRDFDFLFRTFLELYIDFEKKEIQPDCWVWLHHDSHDFQRRCLAQLLLQ